jgi:hypothetical protein
MYHQPVERLSAIEVEAGAVLGGNQPARPDFAVRLWSIAILCGLPLIGLYLLFRLAWADVRALGRGIRLFSGAVADELSCRRQV